MTPIQKSIAEIEAMIARNDAEIEYYRDMGYKQSVGFKQHIQQGLKQALSTLTANLEYEREVIERAYKADRSVSNDQADYYYTKTYDNERKD